MFRRHRVIFLLLVLSFIFPMSAGPVFAQETTGSILGTVTDPSGAVIPDAQVVVTNLGTNDQRTSATTGSGLFYFTDLPIGDYDLKVSKAGFKQYVQSKIHLDVNDKLDFHIALTVGEVTQAVTVTGAAPILETASGEVSNLVGPTQEANLPLNGRAFNQLVDLVPGVTPASGRVNSGVGLFSDTNISSNGAQANSNVFLYDGMYNEDNGSNANLLVTPSVDSIAEFKILRNNYSAQFGNGTGAQINIVTKSGTRQFHGDLFEFLRNDKLDANNFFNNSTDTPKGKLRLNQWGGTVGGPFWIPGIYNSGRDKDFFFASVEYTRQVRGNVATGNVPSLRQGEGILDPTCAVTPAPCTPQAADPFEVPISGEANVNPSQIDPNAVAFNERFPLPNANFAANGFNFITNSPTVTNVDNEEFRWDHVIGQKARVMLRFTRGTQSLNGINGQLWGDDSFPSVNSDWKWVGRNAVMDLVQTISPSVVNDFRFGYSHNHITFVTGSSSDPVLASRAGFTFTELFPETSGSFPTLNGVENFSNLQHTAPFFNKTDNYLVADNLGLIRGKHSINLGAEVLVQRKLEPANGGDNEDAGTATFNTYSDFLLGNLQTYSEQKTLNNVRDHFTDVGVYFQDDYKVSSNLTLNLGVRWQYLSPLFSATNNIANFNPGVYDPSQCPAGVEAPFIQSTGEVDPATCNTLNGIITPASQDLPGGIGKELVRKHFNDWEPRFGLAWVPGILNKKLVVRGGFGMYHGRDAGSQTSALGLQPPFDITASLNNITFSQLAPGQLSPFNPKTPQPPPSLLVLDPVFNNPLSYQYSLGFQYEFAPQTRIEINYVGSHQIHIGRNRDINQPLPQFQQGIFDGTINVDSVRPFLGFSRINLNERVGKSRYNSLQIFVNHRVDRYGIFFQAAYTFGRTIADTVNSDSEGAAAPAQDAFHPDLERAIAGNSITHNFTLNYDWELPWFKKAGGYKEAVLGGWELVGITTLRSGLPLKVCEDRDIDGTRSSACQRPNLIGTAALDKGQETLQRFFNTDAFVLQQPGTFGNAGNNLFAGPAIIDWDVSVFKNTRIPWFGRRSNTNTLAGESATLQFRAEFFNAFNHTQFSGVNTTFVPQTNPDGSLKVGAPADPTSGFGAITGARDPREIQFALKLIF